MQVLQNNKGRGVYATKDYSPWDTIFTEDAILPMSSITDNKMLNLSKERSRYPVESVLFKMLSFVSSTPDNKIDKFNPQLKAPLLFLKNKLDIKRIQHLAKNPNIKVTEKELKDAAKQFGFNKEDLRTLVQIFQANAFAIPGLFCSSIGMTLFDTVSMFNHSCRPNAFALVLYHKVIIFCREEIKSGEEITIPYKPLCVPNVSKLLGFDCQCGFCNQEPDIPIDVYMEYHSLYSSRERVDYMMSKAKTNPNTGYVQFLTENYTDLWLVGNNYREDEYFKIALNFDSKPDLVWLEVKLAALTIAYRKGYEDELIKLAKVLQPFLSNKDILEHVLVCAYLTPHIYHRSLVEALKYLKIVTPGK